MHVLIKQKALLESSAPGREQQGKGTQEDCSPMWLITVSGFMVMRSISGLSLASHLPCRYLIWCRVLPGRRQWHLTPVLLPGKSDGRRNMVGYSPWRSEESDTTEWLLFHFSLSCTAEGNSNPLQCSCLENPRDGSLVGCRLWGCTESDTTNVT